MSDDYDDLRASVVAMTRLVMNPSALTAADVDVLAATQLSLGLRAAVCYELRRMTTKPTKAKTRKPSRRRTPHVNKR